MNRIAFAVLIAALFVVPPVPQTGAEVPDWENPRVFGVNKEAPHATMVLYPTQAAARNRAQPSSLLMSLDGRWKFHWVKRPEERPVDFYKPDFDVSSWKDIHVPSNWEMEGMPRVGMQVRIPGEFRTVTWFGRGPQENYWDRHLGAAVGLYSDKVDNLWFPYIEPQETGNRTDVRWVTFTDSTGVGLKATGAPTLYFSAWPFHMEKLEHYKPPSSVGHKHPSEIVMAKDITVNLDYRQMGVGGDDSWGALQHPNYRLPATHYAYKFRLEPVRPMPAK